MKPARRRGWVTIAIALVVVGGVALLWARPRREPAEVSAVRRGPLRVTLDGEGKTRVRERYTIAAPVGGRMTRVVLHPGDRVDEHVVLTRIDPVLPAPLDARTRAEAEARVKAAEASLARSQAQLEAARAGAEFAGREFLRQKQLVDNKAGTDVALDQAAIERERRDREADAARLAMRADRFQLESAQAALLGVGDRRIGGLGVVVRAPLPSTVLRVLRESEGPVASGTPLLEVGDLATLEMVVDLVSTDAVQVEPDLPAAIEQWGGGAALSARVRRVEPSAFTKVSALGVEEQRVNVVLDFDSPPASPGAGDREALPALGDGYQAAVRVIVWQSPGVLKVPMGALFRRGDSWAVFVVDRDRARLRTVGIGHHDGVEAEVLSGVAEGERVVVHPGDKIADGVALQIG
jgi:HlyD family secretion protein